MTDEYWMRLALEQAEIAASLGEVPVGAVVVCNGQVIARAYNLREHQKNALYHAESVSYTHLVRSPGCAPPVV